MKFEKVHEYDNFIDCECWINNNTKLIATWDSEEDSGVVQMYVDDDVLQNGIIIDTCSQFIQLTGINPNKD